MRFLTSMETATYSYPARWRLLSLIISGFIFVFSGYTIVALFLKGAFQQNPTVFSVVLFVFLCLIMTSVYQLLSFPNLKITGDTLYGKYFVFWRPIKYSEIASIKTLNTERVRLPLPTKKRLTVIRLKKRTVFSKYLFIGDAIQGYSELVNKVCEDSGKPLVIGCSNESIRK